MQEQTTERTHKTLATAITLFLLMLQISAAPFASTLVKEESLGARGDETPNASTPLEMSLVRARLDSDPEDGIALPTSRAATTLRSIYSGIDLRTMRSGQGRTLEFAVAPGFDARVITFEFAGASYLSVGQEGELILMTRSGERTLAPGAQLIRNETASDHE